MFSSIVRNICAKTRTPYPAYVAYGDYRVGCDGLPITDTFVDPESIKANSSNKESVANVHVYISELEQLLKSFHGESQQLSCASEISETTTTQEILESLKYHREYMKKMAESLYEDIVTEEILYLNTQIFPFEMTLRINHHAPFFGRIIHMLIRFFKGVLLMEELWSRPSVPLAQFQVGKNIFQDSYSWFMSGLAKKHAPSVDLSWYNTEVPTTAVTIPKYTTSMKLCGSKLSMEARTNALHLCHEDIL